MMQGPWRVVTASLADPGAAREQLTQTLKSLALPCAYLARLDSVARSDLLLCHSSAKSLQRYSSLEFGCVTLRSSHYSVLPVFGPDQASQMKCRSHPVGSPRPAAGVRRSVQIEPRVRPVRADRCSRQRRKGPQGARTRARLSGGVRGGGRRSWAADRARWPRSLCRREGASPGWARGCRRRFGGRALPGRSGFERREKSGVAEESVGLRRSERRPLASRA